MPSLFVRLEGSPMIKALANNQGKPAKRWLLVILSPYRSLGRSQLCWYGTKDSNANDNTATGKGWSSCGVAKRFSLSEHPQIHPNGFPGQNQCSGNMPDRGPGD